MAVTTTCNPVDSINAIESCKILKDLQGSKSINYESVTDVRRKVQARDKRIEEYHVELTRLWQSVRNHTLKKSTAGERNVSDYDEEKDDEIQEQEVERHKGNLEKVNDAIKLAKRDIQTGMRDLRKDHKDSVFCPLVESSWHHSNYNFSPLSFEKMKIKLSHGSKIVSFQEGSEEYRKMYYGKPTTYRIPLSNKREQKRNLSKDDHRQLSHIPDEELPEAQKNIKDDRKAKDANDSVASCFEKWGLESEKNIMIFTDLRLPNQKFLCPENFVSTNGDFDVLVLSEEFVLFCQDKGVDEGTQRSTKISKLQEAWQQTIKDRRRFGEATRDLPFVSSLPIHRVIAVPNLTSDILDELGVCSYHRRFTLCKNDMTPFNQFDRWISIIINSKENDAHAGISREQYRALCARFVGVISKVRLHTYQASIQATDKLVNPKHYLKKGNQNQQCRLYAILTPEQRKLIQDDGRKLKIIIGEFGTGKSLVLLAKVLNLLEDKENPSLPLMVSLASIGNDGHCYHRTNYHAVDHLKEIIDLPPKGESPVVLSISDWIKDYYRAKQKPNEEVKTLVTSELLQGILFEKVKTTTKTVHFFFDEVPLSFLHNCESVLREFSIHFPGSHIWLAVAAHSSNIVKNAKNDKGYEAIIDRLSGTIPSDPPLTGDRYVVERLTRSMRVPRNVFKLVQFMHNNEYPTSNNPSTICGHVVDGPKPLFFELPKCKCQQPKGSSKDILQCLCSVKRLSVTLERVMSKCHLIDRKSPMDPSKCNILINVLLGSKLTKPLTTLLKAACVKLKVKLSFNLVVLLDEHSQADQDDDVGEGITLKVFDQYTFMGCENAVIIGIDPYSLFQCGENTNWTRSMNVFTRTTSLYVHIYWPKEDAFKMWRGDLDAYDDLTAKRQYLTEDDKNDRHKFTLRGRASEGDLIEKLIPTGLIIKMPVSMDDNTTHIADSTQS